MRNLLVNNFNATVEDTKFQQTTSSKAGKKLAYSWLFSIAFNAFISLFIYLGGQQMLKAVDESPLFYIFVLFPLVGIYLLYYSIKETFAWLKFGEAYLGLDNPAHVGQTISGHIDINTSYDPEHQAKVSLSCKRHYIKRRKRGERDHREEVIWQDDIAIKTTPSHQGSRLYFEFFADENLPETSKKSDDYHTWHIQVDLPCSGPDFKRSYDIEVKKALNSVATTATNATNNTLHSRAKIKQEDVLSEYPEITKTIEGTEFNYPASRQRGLAIGLFLSGIILSFVLYFMYQEFKAFFPLSSIASFSIMSIIPLTLIVVGIVILGHRMRCTVSLAGITVWHKLYFYTFKGQLKPAEIADIVIEKSGSVSSSDTTTKVWYKLTIIDQNGLSTSAGDSILGSSQAKLIRQKMIDALGRNWQASALPQRQPNQKEKAVKAAKKTSFIIPLIFFALIAYDFKDILLGIVNHLEK